MAVFLRRKDGQHIAHIVDSGVRVHMRIRVGQKILHPEHGNSMPLNKTSVLFVSVSFIVLMVISLAWLAFYYIQRFRYTHQKERMMVRTSWSRRHINNFGMTVPLLVVCTANFLPWS